MHFHFWISFIMEFPFNFHYFHFNIFVNIVMNTFLLLMGYHRKNLSIPPLVYILCTQDNISFLHVHVQYWC